MFYSLHSLILEAQINILNVLSYKEAFVCNELIHEYIRIFEELLTSHRNQADTIRISAFIPQKIEDLENTLDLNQNIMELNSKQALNSMILKLFDIFDWIITSCLNTQNEVLLMQCFKSIIYVIAECNIALKLRALKIFGKIINIDTCFYQYSVELTKQLNKIVGYLNELAFDVFKEKVKIDNENLITMCDIIQKIIETSHKHAYSLENLNNLPAYIYDVLKSKNCFVYKVNSEKANLLLISSTKRLINNNTLTYDNNAITSLTDVSHTLILENKVVNELKSCIILHSPMETNESEIFVYKESATWTKVKQYIKHLFNSTKSNDDLTISLQQFKSVLCMILRIKLKVLREFYDMNFLNMHFFEESIIQSLLEVVKNCMDYSKNIEHVTELLHIFGYLPACLKMGRISITSIVTLLWPFNQTNSSPPITELLPIFKNQATANMNMFVQAFANYMNNCASGLVHCTGMQPISHAINGYTKFFKESRSMNVMVSYNFF